MCGEPEQYAYQAAILCLACAEWVRGVGGFDTGDSDDYPQPDCSGESPRPGETCDHCGGIYLDGDWQEYVPVETRWARCSACNRQYAYERGSAEYDDVRRRALNSVLVCSNCLQPTVHF
jgi:hypothetical protein